METMGQEFYALRSDGMGTLDPFDFRGRLCGWRYEIHGKDINIHVPDIWNGNPFGAHREMGGQLDRRPGTDRGKGQDLPTWDPGHGPDLFRRIPHGNILEKPWDMSMGLHRADVECRRRDPAGFCSVLVHDRTSL